MYKSKPSALLKMHWHVWFFLSISVEVTHNVILEIPNNNSSEELYDEDLNAVMLAVQSNCSGEIENQ